MITIAYLQTLNAVMLTRTGHARTRKDKDKD